MPKYTAEHVNQMVEKHIQYRHQLRQQGLLQIGQPTSALAGNIAARDAAQTAQTQADTKTELERQKLYVDKTTKQPLPTHEGYCLKCQKKVAGVLTRGEIRHKNGAKGVYGPCPTCGTPVHAFVAGDKEAKK